jgi:FkbM family methyltransferase
MSFLYDCKAFIRGLSRQAGIAKQKPKDATVEILDMYGTDVVLDVGANSGQYARRLISMGYANRIVSFEPLKCAFAKLRANARPYSNWKIENIALGSFDGVSEINVSRNSQSSSLREMLPAHSEAEPSTAYVGRQPVTVRRLDSILDDYWDPAERCFLKLDVQGFEKDVLDGAVGVLDRIDGLQLEMAAEACYEGETLFPEMVRFLMDSGFALSSISNAFSDHRTRQMLQVEGIFYRKREFSRIRAAA